MKSRPLVGETVVVEVAARVIAVSDSHGLSIKVVLPKGEYLYPRQIWLEPSEIRGEEANHDSNGSLEQ